MELEHIKSVMSEQKSNLSKLQDWMRNEHIKTVRTDVVDTDDEGFRVSMVFDEPKSGIRVEKALISQTLFGPHYEAKEQQEVSPIIAIREILRFTLESDPLMRRILFSDGASLIISDVGPMSITSEEEISYPKKLIN